MAEEALSVDGAVEVPADSLPEDITQTTEPEETKAVEEPVDEKGVPLKNREAEAQRKARSMARAEKDLLTPTTSTTPEETDAAIKLVEQITEAKILKRLEPVLAKQFLMENPDAAEMIDDINRIRNENPELSGIDKLDLAYKIAKSERQDELIRKGLEAETKSREETLTKSTQAAAEGTGRTKATTDSLESRINSASSLKELRELEAMLPR